MTLEEIADKVELLGESIDHIFRILGDVDVPGSHPADFEDLGHRLTQATQIVWDCQSVLYAASKKKKRLLSGVAEGQPHHHYGPTEFDQARHDFRELGRELSHLSDFNDSSEAHLANKPAFLLIGDAGTGKTHLFCDIAETLESNPVSSAGL
ncbi:MAG: hypothetical protein M1133_12230 [Armatimonadetes bacterium]|nr:hypothetical protein [Armatimonadota bacterium]